MRSLRILVVLGIGALACTRASFHDEETGDGGRGGGVAGIGGTSGTGGAGQGGGGTGMGGSVAGGTGGSAGTGTGGSAGTGTGGIAGTGTGGSAGTGGRGGAGGTGTGGTTGTAGRGGTGGVAGTGGTGGSAGTGGRGGTGGMGGTGGATAGTAGGGRGGTGTGGTGGPVGVMPNAPGQIVITELMHNSATVADDYGEWFEVFNPSTTVTFDLMGCQVLDSSLTGPVITTSLVLPPMTFKTLAVSATPGGPGGTAFTPDFVYGLAVKFDNDAGERAAISCGGMVIDDFVYPTAVAGGGGRSLSLDPRHFNAADNDVTMTFWCLARNTMAGDAYEATGPNFGTPGQTNPPCPGVAQ